MQKTSGPSAQTLSAGGSHKPRNKVSSGTSSFCSEQNYSKFTIDKLDLSNIMNASELFQFLPDSNLPPSNVPSSFNDATLASKLKANRKGSSETVAKELFFLNLKNEGQPGESEPYEALFPPSDAIKSSSQVHHSKVESCLWDLTYSQEDKSREYDLHKENGIEQEFNDASGYNDLSLKHNQSLLENLSAADHPDAVKKMKDLIYKLQLKDAIQRQEISKLKKVNEKMQKDSKSLEARVGSLEKTRNTDSQCKSDSNSQINSRQGSEYGKSKHTSSNCSFQDGISLQYEQKFQDLSSKTSFLMQQIEQINSEKKQLEETIKTLLLEKELAKTSKNETKQNITGIMSNFTSTHSNVPNTFNARRTANINQQDLYQLQTPQSQPGTPQKEVSQYIGSRNYSKQATAETSPIKLLKEGSLTNTPKTEFIKEKSIDQNYKGMKSENVHLQELSSVGKNNKKATTYSQLASKLRGITNSTNTPISPVQQEKKSNTPQVNDFMNKLSAQDKNNEGVSKNILLSTQQNETIKNLNSTTNFSSFLADYSSKGCPTINLKIQGINTQPTRASSPLPVKLLSSQGIPVRTEIKPQEEIKKTLNEDQDSENYSSSHFSCSKRIDTSVLNNVAPAVRDIIEQHQSCQRSKSNPRSSVSAMNYNSKDRNSGLLSSASRGCARRLNLENLSTYESREKENRKTEPDWMKDLGLQASLYNSNQVPKPSKFDLNTIERHIEESNSIFDLMEREKQTHESMNLTLEELSEYRTLRQKPLGESKIFQNLNNSHTTYIDKNKTSKVQSLYQSNEPSSRSVVYPVILNSQPQGKLISPKKAQQVLENIRAKMQRK